MTRSYRYRLSPTAAQEAKLLAVLDMLRELYNAALQERIALYRSTGGTLSAYDQFKELPAVRDVRPDLPDLQRMRRCSQKGTGGTLALLRVWRFPQSRPQRRH